MIPAPPPPEPRTAPLTGHPGAAAKVLWTVAFAVVTLLLAPRHPYPVRHLGAELRMLALCFPLILAWLAGHTHNRRQAGVGKLALNWFLAAVVVRFVGLVIVTELAVATAPELDGSLDSDAYQYGLAAQTAIGLREQHVEFRVINKLLQSTLMPREQQRSSLTESRSPLQWFVCLALVASQTGYSSVAIALPILFLGAFFCAQVVVLLVRFMGRPVAYAVGLWLVIGPEYILVSTNLLKDMWSAIGFLYVIEFCLEGHARKLSRRWLLLAPVLAWSYLSRPPLAALSGLFLLYCCVRQNLRPNGPRQVWDLAWSLLFAIGFYIVHQKTKWYFVGGPLDHYPMVVIANFWLTPTMAFLPLEIQRVNIRGICNAPIALLWPPICGLMAVGGLLLWRQRLRFPAELLQLVLMWVCMLSGGGSLMLHRHRIPVDWILLSLAACTVETVRHEPAATRRRLALVATAVAVALYAINVLAMWREASGTIW